MADYRWLVVGAAAALMLAAPAHAEPDPHIPDPANSYCPATNPRTADYLYRGFCDGVPFADGSYWHVVSFGLVGVGNVVVSKECLLVSGGAAPPGGCGGAV